ncbi:MAG: hypothetical protein ACUZ77_07835 [Candidatus Brocadiales bacterium]
MGEAAQKLKIKLRQVIDTGKNGSELKDREGNLIYDRNDTVALLQLLSAVNSRAIAVNEYKALVGLEDKLKETWRRDKPELELNVDESALLKKLLSNPQNDGISFRLFHIKTIHGILEQLK